MEKYAHITKMEDIMVQQSKMLKGMNQLSDKIEAHRNEYRELIAYYYSTQREQDLEDDSNHLIPETLHRGVLSEDEIFNLMEGYRETAIRMLEIAVQMLKE